MGLWTGIKYALNSTLGTNEAKPLDEIIRGEKRMVDSESVIAIAYDDSQKKKYGFTTKVDGVMSVRGRVGNNYYDTISSVVSVYENGVSIKQQNIQMTSGGSGLFDIKFPIKKGRTYHIGMNYSQYTFFLDSNFCGQVTDYNYFESSEV